MQPTSEIVCSLLRKQRPVTLAKVRAGRGGGPVRSTSGSRPRVAPRALNRRDVPLSPEPKLLFYSVRIIIRANRALIRPDQKEPVLDHDK